ncbi:MAG: hypothetical protein PHR38_02980 [Bacteroidales bacterium]|nr:hypothetical protein [Bacteroidales bacterium]MDD3907412.1 hypothetical protein [Bacteroidales bacterium]MDD4712024.1 hypothetical protein [Bacteroidales bacterium]
MNKKILNIVFAVGAILVLISSVLVMEHIVWGKYVFASGVALFFFSRLKMTYAGNDFRLKRLNRLYFLSSLALVVASCLQFRGNGGWIVLLLIVAILEFYISLRVGMYEKSIAEAEKKINSEDCCSSQHSAEE